MHVDLAETDDPSEGSLGWTFPDAFLVDPSNSYRFDYFLDVDLDGVCGAEGEEGGVLDEMWKRTLNLPYDTNISLGYGSDAPTDPAACDSF